MRSPFVPPWHEGRVDDPHPDPLPRRERGSSPGVGQPRTEGPGLRSGVPMGRRAHRGAERPNPSPRPGAPGRRGPRACAARLGWDCFMLARVGSSPTRGDATASGRFRSRLGLARRWRSGFGFVSAFSFVPTWLRGSVAAHPLPHGRGSDWPAAGPRTFTMNRSLLPILLTSPRPLADNCRDVVGPRSVGVRRT